MHVCGVCVFVGLCACLWSVCVLFYRFVWMFAMVCVCVFL